MPNPFVRQQNSTPLTELLRACNDRQRLMLAEKAGTSVNYLYSIAGCHRERVNVKLALAIEDASRDMALDNGGLTPVVTARQLATMCVVAPFRAIPAN
jgi:hypothetical protein